MIKNCPVELEISFKTFRAAEGAALKVTSTMLRSINVGTGVPLGFTVATLRPVVGDGVGVGEAPRSSGKRARRSDVTLSTLASSKMFMSFWTWESSCPSNDATAVAGMVVANSSNPSRNLSGNLTLFTRALSIVAMVTRRKRD